MPTPDPRQPGSGRGRRSGTWAAKSCPGLLPGGRPFLNPPPLRRDHHGKRLRGRGQTAAAHDDPPHPGLHSTHHMDLFHDVDTSPFLRCPAGNISRRKRGRSSSPIRFVRSKRKPPSAASAREVRFWEPPLSVDSIPSTVPRSRRSHRRRCSTPPAKRCAGSSTRCMDGS